MNQTSTSTRSARWPALRRAALFTTLLLATATAGCNMPVASDFCDHPLVDKQIVACNGGGSVNARVTKGLALPATAALVEGVSCLATDGTCSQRPSLDFQSDLTAAGNQFQVGVQLAPGDGPGTYTLPDTRAGGINIFGSVTLGAEVTPLHPVAGTVVVTQRRAQPARLLRHGGRDDGRAAAHLPFHRPNRPRRVRGHDGADLRGRGRLTEERLRVDSRHTVLWPILRGRGSIDTRDATAAGRGRGEDGRNQNRWRDVRHPHAHLPRASDRYRLRRRGALAGFFTEASS